MAQSSKDLTSQWTTYISEQHALIKKGWEDLHAARAKLTRDQQEFSDAQMETIREDRRRRKEYHERRSNQSGGYGGPQQGARATGPYGQNARYPSHSHQSHPSQYSHQQATHVQYTPQPYSHGYATPAYSSPPPPPPSGYQGEYRPSNLDELISDYTPNPRRSSSEAVDEYNPSEPAYDPTA